MGLRVLCLACLSIAALLSAAAPAAAVVNGAVTSIFDAPWTAALILHGQPASTGQFCGGSVRDPTHVLTAAHCVFPDGAGDVARTPGEIDVLVGRTQLSTESSTYRFAVASIAFAPGYDDVTGARDVAVLTLAQPIPPGLLSGPVAPINLATSANGASWDGSPDDAGFVTGWGAYRNDPTLGWVDSNELRGASPPIHSDAVCLGDWGAGYSEAAMLCAGDATHDTCYGDSGGPLVVPAGSDFVLAGITSFGLGCADPAHPGVYAEVAAPDIRGFLNTTSPQPAPMPVTAPAVAGTLQVGQTLTCDPGGWTGAGTVDTWFVRTNGASTITLTGATRAYALQPADAGWRIVCMAKATGSGGWARARSAPTAAVAPLPVVNPPGPTPTPTPPQPPSYPPPPRDVNAPRARFAKATCSRKRCVIDVRVSDAGYSAGVKGVITTVTRSVRRPCRRHGKKTTCTRGVKRSLRAIRRSAGRYRITLVRPARGKQRFAVTAVDRAGNRQLKPTVRTVRVK